MNKTPSYKWAPVIVTIMVTTFFCLQITSAAVLKGHDFTRIPAGAEYAPRELLVRFSPKPDGKQREIAEKNQILHLLRQAKR